jgi:hypothetical protein
MQDEKKMMMGLDRHVNRRKGGLLRMSYSDIESERNSVHTIVAKKDAVYSQWRIVAFQNTRAQYIGRPDMVQAMTEDLRREL